MTSGIELEAKGEKHPRKPETQQMFSTHKIRKNGGKERSRFSQWVGQRDSSKNRGNVGAKPNSRGKGQMTEKSHH